MSWLAAANVLPLAGYPANHEQAAAALAFAEGSIEAYTGLVWGAAVEDVVLTQRLSANSWALELPKDVTAATLTSPTIYSANTITFANNALTMLDTTGQPATFGSGFYSITVTRGMGFTDESTDTPKAVEKAASLLVAYYLGLSDHERGQYLGGSQGDFSGTMRLSITGSPEAEALLAPWCESVGVSLT